jgi:hypothetical protein
MVVGAWLLVHSFYCCVEDQFDSLAREPTQPERIVLKEL